MADPFSVAGSAVGVVSLSLSVCQGLFQYYNACREGPEDVISLRHSLEGLIRALDVLRSTMNDDTFDRGAQAHVERFVADCSDAVQNLARELDKIKLKGPPLGGRDDGSHDKLSL